MPPTCISGWEKLFVDYAGQTIPITDSLTGVTRDTYLFLRALWAGLSSNGSREIRQHVLRDDGILEPVSVVLLREVYVVVEPAALLSHPGARDDKLRHPAILRNFTRSLVTMKFR